MPGRRWSDGLHQAVEAKERVKIERENQTLATITFQNYFRKYDKLAGMTGTAETEAPEFAQDLRARRRPRHPDQPHAGRHRGAGRRLSDGTDEKYKAIADDVRWPRSRKPVVPSCAEPSRSRSPSSCRSILKRVRGPPRRAERQVSTSGRRRSSPRRVAGAPSPSRPTWRAAAPTSSSAGTRSTWRAAGAQGRCGRRDPEGGRSRSSWTTSLRLLLTGEPVLPHGPADWERIFTTSRTRPTKSTRRSSSGRPAHHRHRAPRGPPDRQPAPRPRRPAGRSRLVSRFYLVARGRFDADLRIGAHLRAHGAPRDGRRRSRSSTRWSPGPSSGRRSRSRRSTSPSRKHLLEYDDVMNKQRENVYALRRELLEGQIKLERRERATDAEEHRRRQPRVSDERSPRASVRRFIVEDLLRPMTSIPRSGTSVASRHVTSASCSASPKPRAARGARISTDKGDRSRFREALWTWRLARSTSKRRRQAVEPERSFVAWSATSCCRWSTFSGRTTSMVSTTSRKASAFRRLRVSETRSSSTSAESFDMFRR